MPVDDQAKHIAQKDLLQELRDLKSVLDAEADDAIPVLNDVVRVENKPNVEELTTTDSSNAVVATLDEAQHGSEDDIPASNSVSADAGANPSTAESDVGEQSLDQLLAEEATQSAPFALIDGATNDYDTSTAESLIEDGLSEALKPLTDQMDDEALRLVDELVAEHAELIRQQLKQRLAAKSKQLRASKD